MGNDCWLDEYKKCQGQCGPAQKCNCYDRASEKCRSGDDPAEACFEDLHQKCLAGLGFAPDPDRGVQFPR